MKIAILTSGILPVPAVQGGAVENLIDTYLAYNDSHRLHDITVYSIFNAKTKSHPALQSDVNHYHYIGTMSPWAKVRKRMHHILNHEEFYHYSIEYYLEQALHHIQSQEYDMVILENRPGYALKLASITPAKIVHHLHNDVLNSKTPGAERICRTAYRIITVSDFLTNCVETIHLPLSKCTTVYNGINLQHFSPVSLPPSARDRYGLHADDFVLIFTGRVIPEKGIDRLIEAMLQLEEYPRIKLLVLGSSFYGNDNHGDSPFIAQLKTKAAKLGGRLVFTGYTPYNEVPSMLALADVAVLPSIWKEPFGMTCVEAMAMGLPLITTLQGGIPEQVTPDCAILLQADESIVSNLAVSILDLYNHRERCLKMGQASLARSRFFNATQYAENFFKAIEE